MDVVKVYSSSGAHPKLVGKLEAVRKRGLFVEIFMFVEVGCGKGMQKLPPIFQDTGHTEKTTIIPSYDERMLHELSIRHLRMNTKALVEPSDTVLRYRSSDGIL